MVLKPQISSVLKFSLCLTICQLVSLPSWSQVSNGQSISSPGKNVAKRQILKKKQQLDFINLPDDGQFKYSISAAGNTSTFKAEANAIENEIKSSGYGLINEFAYGLNEIFSMNLMVNYSESTSESKLNSPSSSGPINYSNKGFGDPQVGLSAKIESNTVTTILMAKASVKAEESVEEKSSDENSTKTNGNNSSGGNSFTPSVTVHSNANPNVVLATTLSYTIRNERTNKFVNKTLGTTDEYIYTGGNSLSLNLLSEFKLSGGHSLGGILEMTRYEPTVSKKTNYKSEGNDMIAASVYSAIKATESISITPMLIYTTSLKRTVGEISITQYDTYTGLVRTSFAF